MTCWFSRKAPRVPSKTLLFESSIHPVQEKELDRSSSRPAGSGQSPLAEVGSHKVQLNNITADKCEEVLLKEHKQPGLPSSGKMVHSINDKSWTTLSEDDDEAGSSSANDGCNKGLKKSLEAQKEEHKTLKKMTLQTKFFQSLAKSELLEAFDQQDHIEDEPHEIDEEDWVPAISLSCKSCGPTTKSKFKFSMKMN